MRPLRDHSPIRKRGHIRVGWFFPARPLLAGATVHIIDNPRTRPVGDAYMRPASFGVTRGFFRRFRRDNHRGLSLREGEEGGGVRSFRIPPE